jgi:hypothetical protein
MQNSLEMLDSCPVVLVVDIEYADAPDGLCDVLDLGLCRVLLCRE